MKMIGLLNLIMPHLPLTLKPSLMLFINMEKNLDNKMNNWEKWYTLVNPEEEWTFKDHYNISKIKMKNN